MTKRHVSTGLHVAKMEARLLSLSDLSVACLCRTSPLSADLDVTNVLTEPLPSFAEVILAGNAIVLPYRISNQLIEGLAQRAKLTANMLDILLGRRCRLNTLPLTSVMSVHEETIVENLCEQKSVKSIDISLSSCLGDLPVPFLEILVGTPTRDSLVHFAANRAKGAIGLRVLPQFSNLKHLDVSFTYLSKTHLRAAVASLRHLEHLDVSGTIVTWYDVFATADIFASDHLKYLSLHSLEVMSATDWRAGRGDLSMVRRFFGKQQSLSSLDLSYATMSSFLYDLSLGTYCDPRFYLTCRHMLRCTSSLTHLDVSHNCSFSDITNLLLETNRLDQLRFLGYVCSNGSGGAPMDTLTSRPHLKMTLPFWHPDASSCEQQFHPSHVFKSTLYFFDAMYSLPQAVETSYDAFIASGLVPLMQTLCTASRRLLTDKTISSDLSSLFGELLQWDFLFPAANSLFRNVAWEQILENAIVFALRDKSVEIKNCDRDWFEGQEEAFADYLLLLVKKCSSFIVDRPPLLSLTLSVSLKWNTLLASKWAVLANLFRAISQSKRKEIASKSDISSQIRSHSSDIIQKSVEVAANKKDTDKEPEDDYESVQELVFEGGTSLLNAFALLYSGLPDVLTAVDGVFPIEIAVAMAETAFESFSLHDDERGSSLYVAALEALAVIAECPTLAPKLFSKRVVNAVFAAVPRQKSMHVAYSYLACLCLVHDESASSWPSDCVPRERVAASLASGDLIGLELAYRHATVVPLLKMAQSKEFASVASFGLQRLYFFCSSHFDANAYYSRYRLCPICLIRREIGFDVLCSLPVPSTSNISKLEVDLDSVAQTCKNHKDC